MAEGKLPQASSGDFQKCYDALSGMAQRYHADPESRATLAGDVRAALAEAGMTLPQGLDVSVVANTDETFYVVFPPDPNTELSDEALAAITGGGSTQGTAGTFACASTFACPSTAGTLSSFATVGSIG